MNTEKALFILRHGSYEGHQKYLEAVKVIEDELDRKNETIEQLQTALFKCGEEMATARVEAVKEFAEKLKEDVEKMQCCGYTFYCVGHGFVDNLVKEFTEGG